MNNLNKNLFNPNFSHIYIESDAMNYPTTKAILSRFKYSTLVEINHYKDVFSRGHQNFSLQKESLGLILAIKKDNLIYEGSSMCDDFGNHYFYYTSTIMNCIYNCEYCYLQGMYSSANIVIFVNIEDIFKEIETILKSHPMYLCISYDTDILALENILGYGRKWLTFAKSHPSLKIELRTKSSNFNVLEDLDPLENVIFAWTLSPSYIVDTYENKTPPLKARVFSAKKAMDKGWKVRLCFDPMIYFKNWRELYDELIASVFESLNPYIIYDISIGMFRVSKDYLKKMRKNHDNSIILSYPFETINGICSYKEDLSKEMTTYLYEKVSKYISKEKIYVRKD